MENPGFGISQIFKEIANLINLADQKEEKEIRKSGTFGRLAEKGLKGSYGVNVRFGLGDKTTIINSNTTNSKEDFPNETIIDIFDEGNLFMVVADLPGADQNSIRVKIEDGNLLLEASGPARYYSKDVLLPAPVRQETIKTSYQNGVLQISLLKAPITGQL